MRIAVTPADQVLARLDVDLAARLGEDVDPRVEMIARADLSRFNGHLGQGDSTPTLPPAVVWLDDQTGEVVAVSEGPTSNGSTSENGLS